MRLKVKRLTPNQDLDILYHPDNAELETHREELGLQGLRKMRLAGRLIPVGKSDWRLDATLGATVVQACVVTLDPVTTRIETPVIRLFEKDFSDPEEPEAEMPRDDTVEALGDVIDLAAIAQEALALALPDFPRSDGAELEDILPRHAPDDAAERPSPFAALEQLKGKFEKPQ